MCLWSDKEAQKELDVLERFTQKLCFEAHDCGKMKLVVALSEQTWHLAKDKERDAVGVHRIGY